LRHFREELNRIFRGRAFVPAAPFNERQFCANATDAEGAQYNKTALWIVFMDYLRTPTELLE